MNEFEKYEKFFELVMNVLSVLSGHFEDILNVIHAFKEDPNDVDLEELERKIRALQPLPEE